ncbi:MAG: hypothetical protein F4W89_10395 [Acidobacteria bacterium]|nr:hypothetical protein [Acidobacteriota bacterium]
MRAVLARGLPLLLATGVAHAGCGLVPPAAESGPADAPRSADSPGSPTADPARAIPDLRLERLFAERPPPREIHRNPFRFGPATPPEGPEPPAGGSPPPLPEPAATAAPNAPGAASAPRPVGIPLRLIGIVEVGAATGPVAVLTDDRSVHHGRAGDTIEGRYRIISTDEASVELEDLTTGARMTLRLSGY